MSFANQNAPRMTNEEILLANALNTMYNDNQRQIQTTTAMLSGLIESNQQIRRSLTSLLGRTTPQSPLVLFAGSDEWFTQFMQPIDIYPTPTQIEIATRVARYGDITRPINTSCPISMEEFDENDTVTVIRQCGHIFHTEPLTQWFRTNCRCPVCRYDVRDYRPQTPADLIASSSEQTERRPVSTNDIATVIANIMRRTM